ncbi:MAG: hypothetical protein ACK6DC_07715 [Planctomycetota bacterium]|jgi:hypothetical protein
MQEYSIQRSGRRCQQTDRAFVPGESYYSAVTVRGGELRRMDLSVDAWKGPPPGAVGWWQSRMPDEKKSSTKPAPTHVLLSTLETLLMEGTQPVLATMLALLLVRRRILSEPTMGVSESVEQLDLAPKNLHLVHPSTNREFHIPVCEPPLEECERVQEQLTRLLFCED